MSIENMQQHVFAFWKKSLSYIVQKKYMYIKYLYAKLFFFFFVVKVLFEFTTFSFSIEKY